MVLNGRTTMRALIGLLVLLAHLAFQPTTGLAFTLCTEADGRTSVEFAAVRGCETPIAAVDQSIASIVDPCCIECSDQVLSVEASAAISAKRGEAPRTVLPTGPPSLDVAGPFLLVSMAAGSHVPNGRIVRFDGDFRDPFLVALGTSRLLI
jgi:hypothetical protein